MGSSYDWKTDKYTLELADERLVPSKWLRFSVPRFRVFSLEVTQSRKSTVLGPAPVVISLRTSQKEMLVNVIKLPGLGGSVWRSNSPPLFSSPSLHRHLLLPEEVLVSAQRCGTKLTALLGERGLEREEEEAPGLVCLAASLEEEQEVCQDTCAMSLTRVWMSWRHRGHVSNCKAHSIHIPLWRNNTTFRQVLPLIHRKCLIKAKNLGLNIILSQKQTAFKHFMSTVLNFLLSLKRKHTYPCPQGRSSVSAMTSQQSVQQLSLMLTCFSKARRRCLKNRNIQKQIKTKQTTFSCRHVKMKLLLLCINQTGYTSNQTLTEIFPLHPTKFVITMKYKGHFKKFATLYSQKSLRLWWCTCAAMLERCRV